MKRQLEESEWCIGTFLPLDVWLVIQKETDRSESDFLYLFSRLSRCFGVLVHDSLIRLHKIWVSDGITRFYAWKHRIQGERLDLVRVRMWSDWGEACLSCKQDEKNDKSGIFEVWLQWGDTDAYEDMKAMCGSCLFRLNTAYIHNKSPNYMTRRFYSL